MTELIQALAVLRTPALLLVLGLFLWFWFQLKALKRDMNGLGAKINRIEQEEKQEASKTRIAVAGLAGKVNAPELLQEFLK